MDTSWGIDIGGILLQLGEDLNREGLLKTPDRVERAWAEFLEGYTLDPEKVLGLTFRAEGHGVQAGLNINFSSMCEHHLLPFFGSVTIVYKPNDQVAGLSKLARLVDCFARRLQIQERMTQQIADALFTHLDPVGAMCVISAEHGCMAARGVEEATGQTQTLTSSIQGVFIDKVDAREEFYQLVELRRRS